MHWLSILKKAYLGDIYLYASLDDLVIWDYQVLDDLLHVGLCVGVPHFVL